MHPNQCKIVISTRSIISAIYLLLKNKNVRAPKAVSCSLNIICDVRKYTFGDRFIVFELEKIVIGE